MTLDRIKEADDQEKLSIHPPTPRVKSRRGSSRKATPVTLKS